MMRSIGIIGGGLSGTLMCLSLLRQQQQAFTLYLFEKNPHQLNKGVAYSSQLSCQLLNVPVKDMSPFEEDPLHFLNWLVAHRQTYQPNDFVPRKLYGNYLKEVFEQAIQQSLHSFHIIEEEAISVTQINQSYEVQTPFRKVCLDQLVLCTGNFPPGEISNGSPAVLQDPRYIHNPWNGLNLDHVQPQEMICIIGSGLTMVDQVLSLRKNGHLGKIVVLSRRGLLPQPHGETTSHLFQTPPPLQPTVKTLLQWVRREVTAAEEQGGNWRSVIHHLRDWTSPLWIKLPLKEKQRFLRHLRPYWEIHRHRIPQGSHHYLMSLIQEGILKVIPGKIHSVDKNSQHLSLCYRARGSDTLQTLYFDKIINCTGPQAASRQVNSLLYQNFIQHGWMALDELELGIHVSPQRMVIDAKGQESPHLMVVGPPGKGSLWESTALREIRIQVRETVQMILNEVTH